MSDLVKNNNIYDPIYGGTFNPNHGIYNPREINQAILNMIPDNVKEWWRYGKFTDIFPLIWNKGVRTYQQHNADKEPVSTAYIPQQQDATQTKYPATWFSTDTVQLERRPDQYVLPGSVNLSDTRFGVHNAIRNNIKQYTDDGVEYKGNPEDISWKPVKSPGMIITTFEPFRPYSIAKPWYGGGKLMGVDKYGNLKFDNFQPNDLVTYMPTRKNVLGFQRDANNKIVWTAGHPVLVTDDGKTAGGLLIGDSGDKNKRDDQYGHTTGGGCIVKIDDEARVALGSANQIDAIIQDMRQRHGGKPCELYYFDLGSHSTGLRTYSGFIDRNTWIQYRGLNGSAGNGLYILSPEETKIREQRERVDKNVSAKINYIKQRFKEKKQHYEKLDHAIHYNPYDKYKFDYTQYLKKEEPKHPWYTSSTTDQSARTENRNNIIARNLNNSSTSRKNTFTAFNNAIDSIKNKIKTQRLEKSSMNRQENEQTKTLKKKNNQSSKTYSSKPRKKELIWKNKIKKSEKQSRYDYNNPLYTI